MSLESDSLTGWKLNRINAGPPFHVETIKFGPHYTHTRESLPQVCDARGTVAISGPDGAVFCASRELADALCRAANAGELEAM